MTINRDKLVLYDQIYDPAVTGAIAVNASFDMATVDVGPYVFVIEEMWIWSPYTVGGLPADLAEVQLLIDGEPFPTSPSRMHIRCMAERSMVNPYDPRFARGPFPFGNISLDPLEDTTIKITPAQKLALRLVAGPTAGVLATDSTIRVMLIGRIAETDLDLQAIYGGSMYQPGGGVQLGDPITGKVTPMIRKSFAITINNAKLMSGATGQSAPKITPWWTWGVNNAVIPSTPEYEWTYTNPPLHVLRSFMELSFDWTRITNRAIHIKDIGAYIAAGRGMVWFHQPPYRRPGHKNLYYGWVVNAGFPLMIPGGGALALTPMFQGPHKICPNLLAFNNLTQLRVTADAGTTIVAGDLEIQVRGTHIEY